MSLLAVALIAALIPGTALASPIPTSTSYSVQHVWTVSNINHPGSAAWNEIWHEASHFLVLDVFLEQCIDIHLLAINTCSRPRRTGDFVVPIWSA